MFDRIRSLFSRREAPKLNCRPGDLARFVISDDDTEIDRQLAGCIFRVTSTFNHERTGEVCWRYEPPAVVLYALGGLLPIAVAGVRDKSLRPIRDPGDDAVDEMVARVGPAPRVLQPEKAEV